MRAFSTKSKGQHYLLLLRAIAYLDHKLNTYLNKIIHQQHYKELEARWRGLYYMVQSHSSRSNDVVKFKIYPTNTKELELYLNSVSDISQSPLYARLYNDEYDMAGGEPYSLILLDVAFEFDRVDCISILEKFAYLGAAIFAPVFYCFSYDELSSVIINNNYHLKRWQRLRSLEDSRYLNIFISKVKWRKVYDSRRCDRSLNQFNENIASQSDLCWGSICYLAVLGIIDVFVSTGWFLDDVSLKVSSLKAVSHGIHLFENNSILDRNIIQSESCYS